MSRRASAVSTNGSTAGSQASASSNPRPTLRTGEQIVAALTGGRPLLTAENLARNNSPLATASRTYQAQAHVDRVKYSLGFELPAKTQRQSLERYSEVSPRDRFINGTDGGVGGPVDGGYWQRQVARDRMAAAIEREVRASNKSRKAGGGRKY